MIKILYFSWIRETIGIDSESIAKPADIQTAGELIDWLKTRDTGHEKAFHDKAIVKIALNNEMVEADASLKEGDEIAFFPPFTGG